MTLVVNLLGGPGTGKSTTAAGTFAELKLAGVNAELVTEYAKDIVWGRLTVVLEDQLYVFAKQHRRIHRLQGQVDVIVTDCPLFLSAYYGSAESEAFKTLVLEKFYAYENLNVFLQRTKPYNPAGRLQSEEKANDIDRVLRDMLDEEEIDYVAVPADRNAAHKVSRIVLDTLRIEPPSE